MPLSHARRNSLITGVTTIALAGAATLSLALPQDGGTAEAATTVTSASVDALPAAPTAEESAQAEADAAAKQRAEADAAAAAQAAQAQADADAKAQADAAAAQAQAQAQAKVQAEAKAKADAAAAASRSQQRPALNSGSAFTGTPQQIAAQIVPAGQLQCFNNIIERESNWKVTATNPSSGAYGLVQALPGSKMAAAGADWRTNPATQIKWGLSYMNATYGSPCGAWKFWQVHHAY
ncbi:lytic transglycosylase domain-containing protein [Kitasatospora indigofera]|uniref:aggregation-promoting factor C-terminal-like domain-containing protein n=1 Tax=Kitasatospora indigofera TaxID=67307 RepID=UPI003651E9D3